MPRPRSPQYCPSVDIPCGDATAGVKMGTLRLSPLAVHCSAEGARSASTVPSAGILPHPALASQKGFTVRTSWPSFKFSAPGRAANPFENALSPGNVGSLELDWLGSTDGRVFSSSPVVGGARVVAGSDDHDL